MNKTQQSLREYLTGALKFEEEEHKYTINGKELLSVTQFLKQFFTFDAEKVAEKVSTDTRSKYYGMEVQEILDKWDERADYGTSIHKLAEDFINGEFVSIESDKHARAFEYVQRVVDEFDELYPEIQIYSEEVGLAGTIDLLARHKTKWYILDWKTDEKIRTKSFNGEKCAGLLFEWDKCNFNKYIFQLGIYRFILEHKYGIPISGIKVVHFEKDRAREYILPYPVDYIELILRQRWKEINDEPTQKHSD